MKTLFLLIFAILQIPFAQQKYLIFFTTKTDSKVITPESAEYNSALSLLSKRSIERRKKIMGDNFIKEEDLPVKAEYISFLKSNGIKVENILKWLNAVSAYLTEEQVKNLGSVTFIKKIEPVKTLRYRYPEIQSIQIGKSAADSSLYGNSYTQLRMSGIPRVHDKGIIGEGVLLGILDTGFRWRTHESLTNADVLAEYDFIFKDSLTENEPEDAIGQHNHGTTVLSVIAGYKDSVLIGAAYGTQLILAKTEDIRSETRVEEDNFAAALEWMENFGVDITTNSLGYSEFDNFSYSYEDMDGKTTVVTKAAELAFERGVLTISSAGNEGIQPWFHITAPADGFNTIAVGAVDNKNRVADFSSRGPSADGRIKPDITAMGVSVFGASGVQSNLYGTSSGTSLSAPIAAGSAVLLLSAHKHLTNVQMRDILLRTADNFTLPDNERGYGLVSALKAVEYPNIEIGKNGYVIHKIVTDSGSEYLKLLISSGMRNFIEVSGVHDSVRSMFPVPEYTANQVLNFFFIYTGLRGDTIRIPSNGFYTFNYGDNIIRQNSGGDISYVLSYNYPNPFNNTTRINFYADKPSDASLDIFDALGRKVKTLFRTVINGGEYSLIWDGRDDEGNYVASGVYIYRLKLNDESFAKKMILLK